MAKSTLDKLRTAAESERITAALADLLTGYEGVRDWADALSDLADEMEQAEAALQDWIEAEDREDKADAKTEVVDALGNLVAAWDTVTALDGVEGVVMWDMSA